ncbi:MAG: 2-oxoacid:ferredoxin oxidoreductase subunit beta [Pseudomonadales bacterium]|nr:2-oxoacid:ferredoxin oxidoreductase subunit beta [Pseudomonadales bacterium]
MSYIRSRFEHPATPRNSLGYTQRYYEGSLSTLCAGCGHDSISAAIVQACFELSIEPHKVAKLSGIGCSSKTPTYFLGQSHGFNSVHGRMPSVATGANMANQDLLYVGVSGDGDTASIGMGQFAHVVRRGLNMLYIVENNGCYGLTKGQDSATADKGSKSKKGAVNPYESIDLTSIAIELGATFVARSFSGDKTQLVPLLKAAMAHKGFAFIDIISPCVTFNNHNGSTRSYDFVRDHIQATGAVDFIPLKDEITAEYEEGTLHDVTLHDGSVMRLKKASRNHNPMDRVEALRVLREAELQGEVLTGLMYIDQNSDDVHAMMNTTETPLNQLGESVLCPGSEALQKINASFR